MHGQILDVGAGQCGLQKFLPQGTKYVGIGLGGSVDVEVDLEKETIPYEENSFDCVLCLDTLEHLDNIHEVFDELCRVTSKYLIISLPNPWASFMGMLGGGYYQHSDLSMKFYNLPIDPPEDRHKWFYGIHEAERFIKARGRINGMQIPQMDRVNTKLSIKGRIYGLAFKLVIHKDIDKDSLWSGSLCAVMIKIKK